MKGIYVLLFTCIARMTNHCDFFFHNNVSKLDQSI